MLTIGQKYVLLISLIFFAGVMTLQSCHKEHPEHPETGSVQPTKDQLADAIEIYVAEKSAPTKGVFMVVDPKTSEKLELVLDKVHRERLSKVADNKYFACADFTTKDGKVYDLDVFMTADEKGNLTFSEFTVHKEDGKERYIWYEEDGVWKKKQVNQ